MKEIGGYIELDSYDLPMLYEDAIALNSGRNALAYLIQAKNIKKIRLPKFLCNSVYETCIRENVRIEEYSINMNFQPSEIEMVEDEWLYVVNYYGQLSDLQIKKLAQKYKNIIIDNAQAYFQKPVKGIDTIYTCRKFFGVSDGALLFSNKYLTDWRLNFLICSIQDWKSNYTP